MNLEFHPLADLFPLMTEEELEGLTADIKEYGQREPIVLFEEKILDGRNRYRACEALGLQVKSKHWDGQGSAQAFVVSHNLHRRHLNASQRAIIAARLVTMKRGDVTHQRATIVDENSALLNRTPQAVSVLEAATLMNVGKTTVNAAKKVLKEATPKEIIEIESGKGEVQRLAQKLSAGLPEAERIIRKNPNPEEQRTETKRANGRLWGLLREALENLTNLPRPAHVARIARGVDRGKVTDTKLLPALQWLSDFADEWTATETAGGRKPSVNGKENNAPI